MAAGCAGTSPAQEARQPATELRSHDEVTSRAVFSAADRDGDDRLSILEVGQAFEGLGGPRDLEPFRRIDTDQDGYLEWQEFDRRFAEITTRGGRLRIRLPFGAPARPDESRRPLAEQAMALLDTDKNERLAAGELTTLASIPQFPPSVAAILREFDRDGSADLSVDELLPLVQRLPAQPPTEAPRGEGGGTLPATLAAQDRNRDGVIDRAELGGLLERLDPTLARWLDLILKEADQNGSGALGPIEIVRAATR